MMKGELGVLYQNGKQIGGFKSWQMKFELLPIQSAGWAAYQPSQWKAFGKQPFFLEKPTGNIFDVVFYQVFKGQLIEIYKEKVEGILPTSFPLNIYLAFSLVMRKA